MLTVIMLSDVILNVLAPFLSLHTCNVIHNFYFVNYISKISNIGLLTAEKGTLTELEGLVQLTSSLSQLVFLTKLLTFSIKKELF
jgi:hypothetical protein